MYNSEESTVGVFDYFKFSNNGRAEVSPDFSKEQSLSLPNFDDEGSEESGQDLTKADQVLDMDFNEDDDINTETKEDIEKLKAEILLSAHNQADEILKQAEEEAIKIKDKAYTEGTDAGYADGFNKAYEENKAKLDEGTVKFFLELKDIITQYKEEKDRLLTDNVDEIKDVIIAISEKIVHVSLKSSGDIIKKMIVSATEKMRYKEWAKIYISKSDSSLLVESNTDLLKAISHLSEHIKITVMEDAAPGTCIIELPDQIIDASAATQLDNIRGILKGGSTGGGNDGV